MSRALPLGLAVKLGLLVSVLSWAEPPAQLAEQPKDAAKKAAAEKIAATVESTLATGEKHIRQFAFDGDADTYFASEKNPTSSDHFTLVFDKPVAVKSIAVVTGKPKGGDALNAGVLQASEDGEKFEDLANFKDGEAKAKLDGKKIQAIRVQPTEDMKHPLAIREFVVQSDPVVAVFKYPIEFFIDVSAAPEMKEWTEKTARVCERQYPMICEELMSEGFKPRTTINLKMDPNYNGVAEAGGGGIRGSVKYFKAHEDDVGAFVHETVHCVQDYHGRGNPGWMVEGIADYIRFVKYEPGKLKKLKPEQAKYNGSYRITAAFLAFVSDKYDKEFVKKINAKMRDGKYKEDLWKDLTGKTLMELGDEWKESLKN
jgi:hypothetical protein